jgi:hypothetical protein
LNGPRINASKFGFPTQKCKGEGRKKQCLAALFAALWAGRYIFAKGAIFGL